MRGGIHHIDLTVKDAHASRAFYESVLGFMGYRGPSLINDLSSAPPNGYDFDLRDGDSFCSIGILSTRGPNANRMHDRYSPGLHHIAWTAESRDDVDAMHAHLIKIGAEVLFAPIPNTARPITRSSSAIPMASNLNTCSSRNSPSRSGLDAAPTN